MRGSHMLCNLHRRIAASEIEELLRYSELMNKLLQTEGARLDRAVDEIAASMSPEDRDEYLESRAEDYQEISERFPNQLQLSLLTMAYSILENRLIRVAESMLKAADSKILLNDLAGESPLGKVRKGIEKIAQLEIEDALWKGVEPYRLIRNAVAHSNAEFKKGPPQLVRELVDGSTCISFSPLGYIVLKAEFLAEMVRSIEELYESIFNKWAIAASAREVAL